MLILVLLILFILISIFHLCFYYNISFDLVLEDNKKKLLLWYNKKVNGIIKRHWIKLLEF